MLELDGLLATLADDDAPDDARIDAARALGRENHADAAPLLVQVLRDNPHSLVAWAARDALGRIRHPDTAQTALAWLDNDAVVLRGFGAELLGQMGIREAAPALLTLLLGDHPLSVREKALEALGRVGDPDVVGPLLTVFEDGPLPLRVRIPAVLARLHSAQAVPALIVGLDDPDLEVRGHCIDALRVLDDRRAIPRLREILEEEREPLLTERVEAAIRRIEAS